jgi:hypothetical protein
MSAPARLNPQLERPEGLDEVEASWERPSLIERLLVSPEISLSLMPPKGSAKGALGIAALVILMMCLSNLITEIVRHPAGVELMRCLTNAKSVQAPQRCSWFASDASASTAPTTPAAPDALNRPSPFMNLTPFFGLDSFEWSVTLATGVLLTLAAWWAWMATRCRDW